MSMYARTRIARNPSPSSACKVCGHKKAPKSAYSAPSTGAGRARDVGTYLSKALWHIQQLWMRFLESLDSLGGTGGARSRSRSRSPSELLPSPPRPRW